MNRTALACLAVLAIAAFAMPAGAVVIGGAGGMGVFSGVFQWFETNMMEGIIVLGVMIIGVLLLLLRFHVSTVASVCAGIAVLANAVAIGSGAMSASSLLGGNL